MFSFVLGHYRNSHSAIGRTKSMPEDTEETKESRGRLKGECLLNCRELTETTKYAVRRIRSKDETVLIRIHTVWSPDRSYTGLWPEIVETTNVGK